jgi:hypothetical protein
VPPLNAGRNFIMKTIYSLQEFRQEVLKLAAKKNETFTSVEVRIDNNGKIDFRAYINGLGWQNAPTMEGCLQILKDIIEPPIQDTNNNVDVEIEMPESETIKTE